VREAGRKDIGVVKFGTSGLRGLVVDLTAEVVADHTAAFLRTVPHQGRVLLARDLRQSSPHLQEAAARAAAGLGVEPIDCGEIPTPALALAAERLGHPAIMVTGSHIPADRNGLKFYRATGEITKADEAAILAGLGSDPVLSVAGLSPQMPEARADYLDRYLSFYSGRPLAGTRIGLYQHSSVARDLMVDLFEGLGAETVPLGRSDQFVPVDTEAVDADTRAALARWARDTTVDAIVSTDGDADRPLLTDAAGVVIPGDLIGVIAARALGATVVVTPVSSNTGVERTGAFERVVRCRIGSPFVIAGMKAAMQDPAARVVGYEANGGFLIGYAARRGPATLPPLMTRDFALPVLATLVAMQEQGRTLRQLVEDLPPRRTAADRLTDVPGEVSQGLVARLLQRDPTLLPDGAGDIEQVDTVDGTRLTLANGTVIHVRPSGNAPELRCYVEAGSDVDAQAILKEMLGRLTTAVNALS
jgi:phosphomannomutase